MNCIYFNHSLDAVENDEYFVATVNAALIKMRVLYSMKATYFAFLTIITVYIIKSLKALLQFEQKHCQRSFTTVTLSRYVSVSAM